MKIAKCLALLLVTVFTIESTNAQVSNADSMIHKLFSTLQTKNEKAFVALYPNAKQFSVFMRTIMEQMMNSEQMQQMMAMDEKSKNLNIDSLINAEVSKMTNPEAFAKMEESFATKYKQIINTGEQKGINWSDAKISTYTIDSASALDNEMEMLQTVGFKAMKGVIDFSSAGKDYHMSYEKIMFIPSEGGWYGGEFPVVALKSESLVPPPDETAIDSLAVTPKKVQNKTKTKTSKTKTKVKTPARKPVTKS